MYNNAGRGIKFPSAYVTKNQQPQNFDGGQINMIYRTILNIKIIMKV